MSTTVVDTKYVIDLTVDDDVEETVSLPKNSNKRSFDETVAVEVAVAVQQPVQNKKVFLIEEVCGCGSKDDLISNKFGDAFLCNTCIEQTPECSFCVSCGQYQETDGEFKCGMCQRFKGFAKEIEKARRQDLKDNLKFAETRYLAHKKMLQNVFGNTGHDEAADQMYNDLVQARAQYDKFLDRNKKINKTKKTKK